MVRTLQDMLDEKNKQLQAKEDIIQALRKQMVEQSEIDGIEIAKLRHQMSLAAGDTLSKLKEIVIKNEHGYDAMQANAAASSTFVRKYEQLTREELSKALEEKDGKIRNMQIAIEGYIKKEEHLKVTNANLNDQIGDLTHQLAVEREQVELKAKMRDLANCQQKLEASKKLNEQLKTAVDKLNERMQRYEIDKSGVSEAQKMEKLQD